MKRKKRKSTDINPAAFDRILKAKQSEIQGVRERLMTTLAQLQSAQTIVNARDQEILELKHEVTYFSQTVRSLHWSLSVALDSFRREQKLMAKSKTTNYHFDGKEWNIVLNKTMANAVQTVQGPDDLALAQ